jgi:Domain of unknown function (DUF5615)
VSQVRFLLDEQIPAPVRDAVMAAEPVIEFRQVGIDSDVPPKGTLDPDVLLFAEQERFELVTFDKRTMPDHVADHLAAGHHTWGVFLFPKGNYLSAGRIAEELVLVWAASQHDEWVDRIEKLPY